jgi:hypothetical protein
MGDFAGKKIGYRLNAPVRVPGKARQIFLGLVGAEVVQQKEWIEGVFGGIPEHSLENDTGSIYGTLGLEHPAHPPGSRARKPRMALFRRLA